MSLWPQITLISVHVHIHTHTNQSPVKIKCSATHCSNNTDIVTFNTPNRLAPANSQRFSVYSCVGVYVHEGLCRPFLELVLILFVTVHHPVTIKQLVFISH